MAELDTMLRIPGLSAELDLAVGKAVKDAMSTPERSLLWRQLGAPMTKRIDLWGKINAAQAGLSTPRAFFSFKPPSPQQGRYWSIRMITITAGSSATPFTSTALANVVAAIFVTGIGAGADGTVGANQEPPDQDSRVVNLSLPTTQFFGVHQLFCRGRESLVLGFQGSGLTSGLTLAATAHVVEIDDSPEFITTL